MAGKGSVQIDIEINDKKFDDGLKKSKESAKKAGKEIGESVGKAAEDIADSLEEGFDAGTKAAEETAQAAKSAAQEMADAAERAGKAQKEAAEQAEKSWKEAHDKMQQESEKTFDQFTTAATVAVTALAAALGGLAVQGIKYNATLEQYTTSFEVMTGSAQEAADIMERLVEIGAATPFEAIDLAKATQRLMAFGFSAQEAIDQLMILGDISQGDAAKLDSLTLSLGKMQSSQKVTLEYLNIMIEQGFNPLNLIAKKTGETMAEVYDRVSAGSVSVQEVKDAMVEATSAGGQFFNSMQKQSETLQGRLSTLADVWNTKLATVTKEFANDLADDIIPAVTEFIEEFDLDEAAEKAEPLLNIVKLLTPALAAMLAGFAGYKTILLFNGAITAGTAAMKAFTFAMSTNPVGALITGLAMAAAGGIALISVLEDGRKEMMKAVDQSEVLGESYTANYEAIMDQVDAYNQMVEARNESISESNGELAYMQQLGNELVALAQKGDDLTNSDRARAEFITGELNAALGTEYSSVDILQGKYQDLQDEINRTIETKKANIMLSAYEEEYSQAIQNQLELYKELGDQRLAYEEIQQSMMEKNNQLMEIANGLVEKYGVGWENNGFAMSEYQNLGGGMLEKEITQLSELLGTQKTSLDEVTAAYGQAQVTIQGYEAASAALLEGDVAKANEILTTMMGATSEVGTTAIETALGNQEELGGILEQNLASLETYNQAYTDGVEGYTQEGLEEATKLAAQALIAYEAAGGNIVQGSLNGLNARKPELIAAVQQMAKEVSDAYNNALEIGSPSKKFEKSSYYMIEGGVIGIKENKRLMLNEMKLFARELSSVPLLDPSSSGAGYTTTNNKNITYNQIFNTNGLTSPYEAYRRAVLYGN